LPERKMQQLHLSLPTQGRQHLLLSTGKVANNLIGNLETAGGGKGGDPFPPRIPFWPGRGHKNKRNGFACFLAFAADPTPGPA